eukprot:1200288-Prymnesium_polylepis.1
MLATAATHSLAAAVARGRSACESVAACCATLAAPGGACAWLSHEDGLRAAVHQRVTRLRQSLMRQPRERHDEEAEGDEGGAVPEGGAGAG